MRGVGAESPVTDRERAWVKHCASQLGVTPPDLQVDYSVHDIAYAGGTILLGRLFLTQPHDTFTRYKKLCHETMHAASVAHDDKARSIGYYSKPKRDVFTREVTRRFLLDFEGRGTR